MTHPRRLDKTVRMVFGIQDIWRQPPSERYWHFHRPPIWLHACFSSRTLGSCDFLSLLQTVLLTLHELFHSCTDKSRCWTNCCWSTRETLSLTWLTWQQNAREPWNKLETLWLCIRCLTSVAYHKQQKITPIPRVEALAGRPHTRRFECPS